MWNLHVLNTIWIMLNLTLQNTMYLTWPGHGCLKVWHASLCHAIQILVSYSWSVWHCSTMHAFCICQWCQLSISGKTSCRISSVFWWPLRFACSGSDTTAGTCHSKSFSHRKFQAFCKHKTTLQRVTHCVKTWYPSWLSLSEIQICGHFPGKFSGDFSFCFVQKL